MEKEKLNTNVSVEEINNPNFYFGSDVFAMPNGDIYTGAYCAHKSGILWREGHGVYVSKDQHVYEGTWENDQLLDSSQTNIKYSNGVEYHGAVKKGKYYGEGTYLLPNKLPIKCEFEENMPVGPIVYADENDRLWKGISTDSNEVLLLPENQFYVNMPYERGIGEQKVPSLIRKTIRKSIVQNLEESINWIELEKEIFAKSTKTKNDFMEDINEYETPFKNKI